jgi:hypothetical protein
VGIVDSVSNGKMRVIEGNKGGAVGLRDLAVNGRYIRGFAAPKYEEADEMAQVIEDIAKLAGLSVDETMKRLAAAIKDDAWEQAGIDYLVGQNLINQTRPAGAPISWGEFGIVLSRALGAKK